MQQLGYEGEVTDKDVENSKQEPMSMFRISIRNAQLGLAYLMLDQGFDYMNAMKDSMDERKF